MAEPVETRAAACVHEPQEDGRVIVRLRVKPEWAIICQPEEVEKAEAALDTRLRKMMFLIEAL